ncbi:hypothetical protein [Candidatus Enterococcus clewellii]|uniref:YdhG-like domain-containing protein n=1 Tax=Candidatus Enterococcus clewellii TaxID=1834193 RepID=A0A242K3C7_9ENTE|nr:hypothetical protein [Enterococcus sp. 9E7_DIV0242]OTP13498.1 hypothetical protein A5888_002976 [Enterococcus sp. 9E7_DIV0242]
MKPAYDIFELYANYSTEQKEKLAELYELIVTSVDEELTQSLKWNQLSFASSNGTPVRIDRYSDDEIALLVHCQTTLVEQWRELFGDGLKFSGNRAVLLSVHDALPVQELTICLQMAFNYRK